MTGEEERAAIVAWLPREKFIDIDQWESGWNAAIDFLMAAIERGDHHHAQEGQG